MSVKTMDSTVTKIFPGLTGSNFEFTTKDGPIKEPNLEQFLIERGFVSTDRIVTTDEKGKKTIEYVKVITEKGQRAFVELDIDGGFISDIKKDIVMNSIESGSMIPYSIRSGSLECASTDVCGIAFECTDKICILRRDNNLDPKEVVFTTKTPTSSFHLETSSMSGELEGVSSYPIVKMSEIMIDPKTVIDNIYMVSNRLKAQKFSTCQDETLETNKAFIQMDSKYRQLTITYRFAFEVLRNNINTLQDVVSRTSGKTKRLYLNKLISSYDKLDELMNLCDSITDLKHVFFDLNQKMSDVVNFIDDNYSDLNNEFIE